MTTMAPAVRVLQRNLLVYRRVWRGSLFGSFLTPFLFLGAMGVGLGNFIQGNAGFGGYDYLHFLGPGILAATCMQSATFESTFPIMSKITWRKNYDAMLSTPLEVRHLVAGELLWIGFRVLTIAVVFLTVMAFFGIPRGPLALLAVPCAMLTGLAFAAAVIAFAATQRNDAGFAWLFRFVINPLFLFSGTFFPVASLPDPIEWVAAATPLYHGVALVRGTILGDATILGAWPLHLAYLVAFLTAAGLLAHHLLRRRLVK